MFGKRKPSTVDLATLILQGVDPEVFAPKLYEATMGEYYIRTDVPDCELARKYGTTLKSVDDIITFHKAVTPEEKGSSPGANRSRWGTLTAEVARGFMEAGGIKTLSDALTVRRYFGGYTHYMEFLEKELIRRSMPLLVERKDILDFACALTTHTGLMVFALALGYVPINSFDEAIKAHREELRRQKEEEAAQRRITI